MALERKSILSLAAVLIPNTTERGGEETATLCPLFLTLNHGLNFMNFIIPKKTREPVLLASQER